MTPDEAFEDFIDACQKPGRKRRRVLREGVVGLPAVLAVEEARVEAYELKTEQLRRWLVREARDVHA